MEITLFSTQKVSTTSNGDLNITITDIKKSIEKHVIPANTVSKKIAPKVTIDGDEWITLYRSGSTNIKNFTINQCHHCSMWSYSNVLL